MKQIRQITKQEIDKACEKKVWDLGNQILYDLCFLHPYHKINEEIIAKVWLIGRSYAAAIERRKSDDGLDPPGDLFYEDKVAPEIKNSDIDLWFDSLKGEKEATSENAIKIIGIHFKLMELFKKISRMEKRSLASKYLHFHFRDLFYIYDSRSMAAIFLVTSKSKAQLPREADSEYADFFLRCLWLKQDLQTRYGCKLSPRELDNVLTSLSDSKKVAEHAEAHAGSLPGKIWMSSDFDAPLDDFKDSRK